MNLIIWFRALELKATATKSEIKSAYYRLCQIYHPDKTNNCPKAVQRFRTINEAYEELMKAPINTINIKPKPSHTQPKPRYTESKQKYTERKTRYSPLKDRYTEFKAKYPPPKSKAHKTKSESTNRRTNHNTNEQSSNTKSKASSEQDEKERQELRFQRYVTNRLKTHIVLDPQVEEQIRECYRLRFLLINELSKNFEWKETKKKKKDKKSKS